MNETITASQLLYTNVEADLSPTARRGFQIWLCSATLSEAQRLEIAKRLDDFQLPDANADPQTLSRYVFFPLGDALTVIARTVPLAQKDRFGRGGRFFAHALVLRTIDFQRIGGDPFRIIDGPFRFFHSPDDVLSTGIDWRTGIVPEVAVPITTHVADTPASESTRIIFADLIAWLPIGEGRTIAIPESPDIVLNVIRDLFRFLPPDLRSICTFDTLSTGEHLAKLPYRLAGAYSAASLRCWVFKKFFRLDLQPPKITPPLDRAADSLRNRLIVHWLMHPIDDLQKRAVLHWLDALQAGRLAECGPEQLAESTLADLMQLPEIAERVQHATVQRVQTDLPALLAEMVMSSAQAFFGDDPARCLHRLTLPIPDETLADWLLIAFEPLKPPSKAQLDALLEWLSHRNIPATRRLKMIVSRWLPSHLPKLIDSLARMDTETELTRWFRGWCLETMQPEWRDEGALRRIARAAGAAGLEPRLDGERNLFLVLHGNDERESVRLLRFWSFATARDVPTLEAMLQEDDWLYEYLYGDWLADVSLEPRWVCYVSSEEGVFYLGYDLIPPRGQGPRTVPVLRLLADRDKRRFFDTWFLFASPPEEVCQSVIPTIESGHLVHARERLNRYYTEERFARISDLLPKVEDRVFASLINEFLIDRVLSTTEKVYLSDHRFWVGLRIRLLEPIRRDFHLVEAMLQSLLPLKALDARGEEDEGAPEFEHRLRWLMARLRHPRTTERLPLNRNGW